MSLQLRFAGESLERQLHQGWMEVFNATPSLFDRGEL